MEPTGNPPPASGQHQRVRIVLAEVGTNRRTLGASQELTEQSGVGDVLIRGLIRAQFALAVRIGLVVAVGLGSLPLLFAVLPSLADVNVFGIRLPWVLLGILAYPFLLGAGWRYVRSAERNERDFADLVERQ